MLDVTVPNDGPYAFETVHVPGGATDTQLVLFDGTWHEKGYDDNGGIGTAARIQYDLQHAGYKLLVGAYSSSTEGSNRLTNVVANPCVSEDDDCHTAYPASASRGDRDLDSLANALEVEIGTDPDDPDTDGDGLFDYIEVIGHRAGGGEQPTVLYGADPRRRDIFAEFDQQAGAPVVPQLEMQKLQDIFADMPGLPNVDGSTGIAVHVDIGSPCPTPTSCGDWGGSQQLNVDDPAFYHEDKAAVTANFAPQRRGVFRYAFEQTLDGVSGMTSSTWSVRLDKNVPGQGYAHETGHTMGLSHGGTYPERNRKLTYPSLMNYNYSYELPGIYATHSRFSEGQFETIDHRWLYEKNVSVGQSKYHLQAYPYYLQVSGDDVDFNRDGRYTDGPVLFDDGPVGEQRTGMWPEVVHARDIGSELMTGGPGIAVEELDDTGAQATTWVFAPYAHDDGTYPDVSSITDLVGSETTFPTFGDGVPLPGGGLSFGEASAQLFAMSQGERVVVTFPDAYGVLHYNLFDPAAAFGAWQAIPAFPAGSRARNATLGIVDGRLVVLFRDYQAGDGVLNTWLCRLSPDGTWSGWELLSIPSWTTPGIAEATDGNEYLAYVDAAVEHPIHYARRPVGFERLVGGSRLPGGDADLLPRRRIAGSHPGDPDVPPLSLRVRHPVRGRQRPPRHVLERRRPGQEGLVATLPRLLPRPHLAHRGRLLALAVGLARPGADDAPLAVAQRRRGPASLGRAGGLQRDRMGDPRPVRAVLRPLRRRDGHREPRPPLRPRRRPDVRRQHVLEPDELQRHRVLVRRRPQVGLSVRSARRCSTRRPARANQRARARVQPGARRRTFAPPEIRSMRSRVQPASRSRVTNTDLPARRTEVIRAPLTRGRAARAPGVASASITRRTIPLWRWLATPTSTPEVA